MPAPAVNPGTPEVGNAAWVRGSTGNIVVIFYEYYMNIIVYYSNSCNDSDINVRGGYRGIMEKSMETIVL